MKRMIIVLLILGGLTLPSQEAQEGASAPNSAQGKERSQSCTPAYFSLKEPVTVSYLDSDLTFQLLVIGCREDLKNHWPPDRRELELQILAGLEDRHPLEIALKLRDEAPDIRQVIVKNINSVLGADVVSDIFTYDMQFAEDV